MSAFPTPTPVEDNDDLRSFFDALAASLSEQDLTVGRDYKTIRMPRLEAACGESAAFHSNETPCT